MKISDLLAELCCRCEFIRTKELLDLKGVGVIKIKLLN